MSYLETATARYVLTPYMESRIFRFFRDVEHTHVLSVTKRAIRSLLVSSSTI